MRSVDSFEQDKWKQLHWSKWTCSSLYLPWRFTQRSREVFAMQQEGFDPTSEWRQESLPRSPRGRRRFLTARTVEMTCPCAATRAPSGTSPRWASATCSTCPWTQIRMCGQWTRVPWTQFWGTSPERNRTQTALHASDSDDAHRLNCGQRALQPQAETPGPFLPSDLFKWEKQTHHVGGTVLKREEHRQFILLRDPSTLAGEREDLCTCINCHQSQAVNPCAGVQTSRVSTEWTSVAGQLAVFLLPTKLRTESDEVKTHRISLKDIPCHT